jgi:hypothetical protein
MRDSLGRTHTSWLRLERFSSDTTGVAILVDSASFAGWEGRWWRFGDSLRIDTGGPFDAHWLRLAHRESGLIGSARVTTDVLVRDSAGVYHGQETRWDWRSAPVECGDLPRAGRLPQN